MSNADGLHDLLLSCPCELKNGASMFTRQIASYSIVPAISSYIETKTKEDDCP
jgi:radical SAM superfamily enzyme with C-terminal helix-hairpin-helix motif